MGQIPLEFCWGTNLIQEFLAITFGWSLQAILPTSDPHLRGRSIEAPAQSTKFHYFVLCRNYGTYLVLWFHSACSPPHHSAWTIEAWLPRFKSTFSRLREHGVLVITCHYLEQVPIYMIWLQCGGLEGSIVRGVTKTWGSQKRNKI